METSASRPVRGWHVLVFFVGFFGVITAVLSTMTWFAVSTYPGEERAAYQRGLRYNETLARDARQAALGWRVSARFSEGRVVVSLADRDGAPLAATRVEAQIGRPATSRYDRAVVFEPQAPGVFAAPAQLAPGYWNVGLRIEGQGAPFIETARIWVDES